MKFSLLKRKFNRFFQLKKKWQYPKSARVLIYDRSGSELLLAYIQNEQVEIFDFSGELNIVVLFKCLISRKKKTYESCYIDIVNPKVAITFIDNNPNFYLLKMGRPSLITIFIQNGIRSIVGDVFSHLMENKYKRQRIYHVDYMLCFGEAISKKYAEYIEGHTLNIGSFKNNLIKKSLMLENERSILFLSQFRKKPLNSKPFLNYKDQNILWEQFYLPELFFLPLLKEYCAKNGFTLYVCGCLYDSQNEEKKFYEELFGRDGWEFILPCKNSTSYNLVDKAYCIFTIDSTLGYEALVRGKKVALFPARGKVIDSIALNFGWPAKLNDCGPFWSNILSADEFHRIMEYTLNINNEEWERSMINNMSDFIEYDPGNTKFISLMRDLQVVLN